MITADAMRPARTGEERHEEELREAGRALSEVERQLRDAWQGALVLSRDDEVEQIVDAWRAVHRATRAVDVLVGHETSLGELG